MWSKFELNKLVEACESDSHVENILSHEEITEISKDGWSTTTVANLQSRIIVPKKIIKDPKKVRVFHNRLSELSLARYGHVSTPCR